MTRKIRCRQKPCERCAAPDSHIGVHNATLNGEAGRTTDRLSSLSVTGTMGQWLQLHGAPYNVITQMLDTRRTICIG